MKRIITTLMILFASYSFSYASEVKWYNWDEAIEIANEQDKKILIFVQTDWCHVCKRMEAKTYNNQEISDFINENFVAVKINPEDDITYQFNGDTYNPMRLLAKLSDDKCGGIPTTLIYNYKTSTVDFKPGFIVPDEFLPILKKHVL